MKYVLFAILVLSSFNLYAEERNSDYIFTGKLGASPYTGVLGLEVQKNKLSVGFGLPFSASLKYYLNENTDSVFYGAYINGNNNNNYNDTENGIYFEQHKRKEYGVGAGYIWRWESNWSASTGLSIGKLKEEFSNAHVKMVRTADSVTLELSVGYRF